ncbi:MAG: hypothetical protein K6A95_07630 [Bacteroidales bacterium]|jgi:hypothetical protein|nr:hypothetical protein [Bacteroidales bacterium]
MREAGVRFAIPYLCVGEWLNRFEHAEAKCFKNMKKGWCLIQMISYGMTLHAFHCVAIFMILSASKGVIVVYLNDEKNLGTFRRAKNRDSASVAGVRLVEIIPSKDISGAFGVGGVLTPRPKPPDA